MQTKTEIAKSCEWSYNVFKDNAKPKEDLAGLQNKDFATKQEEANRNKPVIDAKPAAEQDVTGSK